MCGLTGFFSCHPGQAIDESLIISMANEMTHRGPDELSTYIDGSLAFGFRRLSIIDLSHGHQPFYNHDKSIILICNGEIYNYKELRRELELKGYGFQTNCDVEVIIHLYTEYGCDFLNKLNGQFAFAIYDKQKNCVFCARDHFGICPFFYTIADETLIFASEIKAILKHPKVKREVDLEGLDQILTFPGPVSPKTLFKNICSLPPGNSLIFKNDNVTVSEYWDLIYPEKALLDTKPEKYYLEKLEDLLIKSVRYRLNADVPIGFYLSGGLDSSLIGALMKSINPNVPYPSFSIGFPFDKDMNEHSFQRIMSDYLNLPNTEIKFDSGQVEQNLKQAVYASESALKESYNTCSLALSECVQKSGLKVILSGEGADELFGGYVGYRFDKQRVLHQDFKTLEEQLEDETRYELWGDRDFFYEKNYYEFEEIKQSLYSENVRQKFGSFSATKNLKINHGRIKNRDILHQRSYIDLKLRLSDHLISDHCDRVTYANSVEGRFPFLDIELVEFVKEIPPDLKLKGLNEKYLLKELARKYLPKTIVDRQKFGFIAPGSPSLIDGSIDWINQLLSYDQIKKQGYFNPDAIENLKKRYLKNGFKLNLPYESDLLIVVLTFNIFLEVFNMPDLI
ncbi:asparagine synthase (glutamine-hydrolyzing) [Mucilaginibacter lappiensis]|uniref:asparagine synthase (glutamine-hydrolyzing) n=1 Tax=Mucilaginibacter lappiensis TaxID=354630 RepID=A0A841JNL5_9SPHI|nr:asparagine synthase (glutamine-hydrolyzing) [Mucilaginibacter lappiensis]MBB6131862.1 asparagine synthase (glutamine-hydrolyzing) [Mucilaginibacter lappiensis]